MRAGDSVLVLAAAGGVGSILGQWLKALGARAIGVVGSEEKAALARQHGYADVIVGHGELAMKVRELTGGRGVPVVYDSIGRDTLEASLDCLAPRGVLVSFGNASGKANAVEPAILAQKGPVSHAPALADYVHTHEELTLSPSRSSRSYAGHRQGPRRAALRAHGSGGSAPRARVSIHHGQHVTVALSRSRGTSPPELRRVKLTAPCGPMGRRSKPSLRLAFEHVEFEGAAAVTTDEQPTSARREHVRAAQQRIPGQ